MPGASSAGGGAGGGALTAVLSKPVDEEWTSALPEDITCCRPLYSPRSKSKRAPVAALTIPLLSLGSGCFPEGDSTVTDGFFRLSLLVIVGIILDIERFYTSLRTPCSTCRAETLFWARNPASAAMLLACRSRTRSATDLFLKGLIFELQC